MNIKNISKDLGRFVAEQSPQILTVLGVAGVGVTVYFTHKAAFKASKEIEDERYTRSINQTITTPVVLTDAEKAKIVWKLYIPAATAGVMTVACIVASNRVHARRFAAIAAAYGVLSGDFDEYRDKASEMLGLKKSGELNEKLARETVVGNLPSGTVLPDGKTWFCDMATKRVFPSTMETVKSGMNKVNFQCNAQKDATLNDFYDAIGVEQCDVGDILGWNGSKHCDLEFIPILTDSHGAVTAFKFISGPFPNY